MNSHKHIFDLLLAILAMFVFVIIYFGQKQDLLTQTIVSIKTQDFNDEISSKGYLTKEMYEDFLKALSVTDQRFSIVMEHRQKLFEPEYRLRTLEEILEEQNASYAGTNEYTYRSITTQKPEVYDPVYTDSTNTETNEDILARGVNTPALASHVHSEECHVGHVHNANFQYHALHVHTDNCYDTSKTCTGKDDNGDGVINYDDCIKESYEYNGETSGSVGAKYRCRACNTIIADKGLSFGPGGTSSYEHIYNHSYSLLNPVCGKEGAYSDLKTFNCFAPELELTRKSTDLVGPYYRTMYEISITCRKCGVRISYFTKLYAPMENYMDYIEVNVGSPITATYHLTEGDAGYTEASQLFDTLYLNAKNKVYEEGKFTHMLPMLGYFNGCPTCNDFKVSNGGTDSGSYLSVQCLRCGKSILTAYGNGAYHFTGFSLYKNGVSTYYTITVGSKYEEFFENLKYLRQDSPTWYRNYFTSGGLNHTVTHVPYNCYALDYDFLQEYLNHGCMNGQQYYCGDIIPVQCDKIIANITPTHPNQTIYVGANLITTVIATYVDGSTKTLAATTNFTTDTIGLNQTVTLSLSYSVAGISYTKTCAIRVTVIPRTKICVNGHTYNLRADGSDPGCPYCRAWLSNLIIQYPTNGNLTIYRGTSLYDNGVTLRATYMDGHTELLSSGYVNNLEKYYVGTQTVTISYKGMYTYLTVITKRNIVLCQVCRRYYELYPDDSDPGCPFCKAKTPVFTGNVLKYDNRKYLDDILKQLYEGGGIYYFSKKDYLIIDVKNKEGSVGSKLLNYLYKSLDKSLDKSNIHVISNGSIRNDGMIK